MAGINNRIFGSDLTARVKAKLTARQNLADKQISPNESVSNNQRAIDYYENLNFVIKEQIPLKQNTDDFLHGTSNNPRPMRRKFWDETEKTKN